MCSQTSPGVYSCLCDAFWTGTNCEISVDECSTGNSPCLNNALCIDTIGGYYCECLAGYTGTYCEIFINQCSSNPCLNNGTCTQPAPNIYKCLCPPSFNGTR